MLFHAFMEQLFGLIQFTEARGAQVMSGAIDVEGQHAHSGSRPFGRDLLRRQGSGDRGRVFFEKSLGRMGGVGGSCHFRRPAPRRSLAMRFLEAVFAVFDLVGMGSWMAEAQ